MIQKEEFVNICKAVVAGNLRRVKHKSTNEEGQVITCGIEEDFVEASGERKKLDHGRHLSAVLIPAWIKRLAEENP